jgi:phage terminase large subunit
VRKINYDENQFLSSTMKDVIDAAKSRDPETFEHVYLGVPRTDDDNAVIKLSWLKPRLMRIKNLGLNHPGVSAWALT